MLKFERNRFIIFDVRVFKVDNFNLQGLKEKFGYNLIINRIGQI